MNKPSNNLTDNQIGLAEIAEAKLAISLMDLTNLDEAAEEHQILYLVQRAIKFKVACICVYPKWLKIVKAELAKESIKIATVVNFPTGSQSLAEVLAETEDALLMGADEIDVVFPYKAYLAGDKENALSVIKAVVNKIAEVNAAKPNAPKKLVKVILETGAFTETDKLVHACREIITTGANFLKTSTGKIQQGASLEAVVLMLVAIKEAQHQGQQIGLKISGGIKNLAQINGYFTLVQELMTENYLKPATFRIGASSLLDELVQIIRSY